MFKFYGTNILIVDDLPENLHALEKVIEAEDRNIFQALSGEMALSLLLEQDFALAILDVMMPGMNGFELAELMRSTERTRHIPIIFVSAGGRELNYAFKGYESGAVDFLHKPLDIAAVKSKVNVFVELHQRSTDVKRQVAALEQSRLNLQQAQGELEKALMMRDDFMTMVAHELRSPLNTLHLDSQMRLLHLQQNNMDAFSAEKLEIMLARDQRQILSMVRLIDDMVDIARIQNGNLTIVRSPFDLSLLLRRTIDNFSTRLNMATTQVSIVQNITGMWDEFRVQQIITNLISNAVRYGGGKPINISLTIIDGFAKLDVHDQGPGIAPEFRESIFKKFDRGNNDAISGGLGMGLFIARELTEAHQGTLTVNSVVGEGSTFTLSLPLTKETT